MAASLDTITLLDMDKSASSRKRKQDFGLESSNSTSSLTAWSDFVYSTPNSPSSSSAQLSTDTMHVDQPPAENPYSSFHADTIFSSVFDQELSGSVNFHHVDMMHLVHEPPQPSLGTASRRHSVAVGELDYHSHDPAKHEFDIRHFNADLQQLLGLPSSWSSSSSGGSSSNNSNQHRDTQFQLSHPDLQLAQGPNGEVMPDRPSSAASVPHKRAMSLRLETSLPASSAAGTPTTPFFSPHFLDALNATDDKDAMFAFHSSDGLGTATSGPSIDGAAGYPLHGAYLNDFAQELMASSPSTSSTDYQHHPHPATAPFSSVVPMMGTIAPSAISSDAQSTGQWMPEQQQKPQVPSTTAKRRASKSKSSSGQQSPPASPVNTIASSTSSSSSSPLITPMVAAYESLSFSQNQHAHPAIPEEDEDSTGPKPTPADATGADAQNRARKSKGSLVTARMLQGIHSAAALKPHIQRYLLTRDPASAGERTIMMLTSKVAQKSYGTEKRKVFLCPPPTTILTDASWWTESQENPASSAVAAPSSAAALRSSMAPPKLTIHISGETTHTQTGALEWYTSSGAVFDGSSPAGSASSGDSAAVGKCVSKQLHINDADEKRKRVEVLAKIQLANGIHLGTFASKGIKVISKPSKKRQSVKNMDLCIHHGTTISLFNRIRSQTVSTKYLGVSSNGQQPTPNSQGAANSSNNGTCFVARTGSWDPFVIWIVDTTRAPDITALPRKHHPTNPHYPPPPAIALQGDAIQQQPLAIHYNQAVVLQCVTTGLVSPVMVIRKVDKGSMVLGGNHMDDLSGVTGGECGDEALGDPVSQLHKVAFQIVQDPSIAHNNKASFRHHRQHMQPGSMTSSMATDWVLPQSCQPITYLACLNDVVGMHKTTTARTFVSSRPQPSGMMAQSMEMDNAMARSWGDGLHSGMTNMNALLSSVVSQEDSKVVRKRRVSCDVVKPMSLPTKLQQASLSRRRVNSLNDIPGNQGRRSSTSSNSSLSLDRRGSVDSYANGQSDGACWTEDVSDAAIWTIVGTDCAMYSFWVPPGPEDNALNAPFSVGAQHEAAPAVHAPITPFPVVTQVVPPAGGGITSEKQQQLTITGENLSRDLAVWIGDIRAPRTDYKSRESITCVVPEVHELLTSPAIVMDEESGLRKLPLLLVRGDGVVYRTGQYYSF